MTTTVRTAVELAQALASGATDITIDGEIAGSPALTLPPGTTLRGGTLHFGAKGLRLTSDNTLDGVTVVTAPHEAAIVTDTTVTSWGTLTLRDVTTVGQIALIAKDAVRAGHVHAERVHVAAADVRGRFHRPHGYGVEVHQGAFTLWNRQPSPDVVLTAHLLDVSAGTADEPVRGSGVFVGGHGDWEGQPDGGTIRVDELRTGEIHTDGGIPEATPDLISGGVFVVTGGIVEQVTTAGPVTTDGQNDMVLDNWGQVERWIVTAPVTSHGPSGIGFVNFGGIGLLDVDAPIVTTGRGARGFNLYDGTLAEARFRSIETTGDGSIGIQVSKPLPKLSVAGDVTTSGGEGLSLVKGVQMTLKAIALSVKPGGAVEELRIGGRLSTSGAHVTTLEVGGTVERLAVVGGIHAHGEGSDAALVVGDGRVELEGIALESAHGRGLVRG